MMPASETHWHNYRIFRKGLLAVPIADRPAQLAQLKTLRYGMIGYLLSAFGQAVNTALAESQISKTALH